MEIEQGGLADIDELLSLLGWDEVDLPISDRMVVNADGMLSCLALGHSSDASLPAGVPTPTYVISYERGMVSLWFLDVPMDPDRPKQVNTWRMVSSMLAEAVRGQVAKEIANPAVRGDLVRLGDFVRMSDLKATLEKAGFARHRLDHLSRKHGGQKMTEDQKAARRANIAKARSVYAEQRAREAEARDERLLQMSEDGADWLEIAEAFGWAVGSVPTMVQRAKRARRARESVSVDALADLLSE